MRSSLSLPMRSTRMATDTLSTESRLIEDRRGIGSSSGSRTTSLAKPRTVVVHGATSARRNRGMTASRESTTTGRRPISGNSHHHTSPLAGRERPLTMPRPPLGTTPDRPTHRPPRAGARHRPRMRHRSRQHDGDPTVLRAPLWASRSSRYGGRPSTGPRRAR
jgi:hypothetical protein